MRSRPLAYAALLAGGVLALLAAAQADGLSQALAGAVLAGTLLMLALRTRGRRVLGLALALVGAGLVVAGLSAGAGPWGIAYAGAGVLVVVGGGVTILTSSRWPARPDRFRTTDEPVDLWRAQDAGLDPTVDPDHPDVRKTPARETMKQAE